MRIANLTRPSSDYLIPPDWAVRPGSTVDNVLVRVEVPLATDPLRLTLKDLVYVEAGLRAEADRYDAVFVNTVADYGVELLRASARVPVVGAGEAGIGAALDRAPSFAVVTVWPSSTQIYYDRVYAATGTATQCRSTRFVLDEEELPRLGGGEGVMASVREVSSPVAERVLRVARDAIEKDGAEAIVLGCTCMTALATPLGEQLPVPVIDPLSAGVMLAQERVAAGAPGLGGVSADSRDRVSAAVAAWEQMGASLPPGWGDHCGEVCATVA